MSDTAAANLANDLRHSTLEFLWRQWKSVGATVTSDTPARSIVDPEVLILMSLWMVDHEKRLADTVWSWVTVNHPLVSVQRLRNLRGDFPDTVALRVAALAAARAREAKDPRWKSLQAANREQLFARSTKVRAIEPPLTSWATLMLQLRLGLGVGVKADVLALALGLSVTSTEWASVGSMADLLRYTTTAVGRAVEDLARARFIRRLDTAASGATAQRMFSGQPGAWRDVLGMGPSNLGWGYWTKRYLFVIDALTWLDRLRTKPISPYARDVGARDILTRHALAFRLDRIIDPLDFSAAELNFDYLLTASGALTSWLRNYA